MGVKIELLRYSAPCAKIKFKHNSMNKEDYELFMGALRGKSEFPAERYKEIFKMPCKKLDPEKTNLKEIRNFFFEEHNKQVMDYCQVAECEVIKPFDGKVLVRRLDNKKEIKALVYVDEKPKPGQKAVFHIDGIVDIL
ncbi:MAG: hypothetical protein JSV92_03290 [archaeon]|nr:MAG: hypothetical protein JSV92_03290 [archaeon]